MKSISENQIKKLWAIAKSFAKKRGYSDYAEDFAQEAVMKILGGRQTSMENLLTDFLRENFGDIRHPTGRFKNSIALRSASLDAPLENCYSLIEVTSSPEQEPEFQSSQISSLVRLPRRALILEMIENGFSQVEVSFLLGVSEACVCQILKQVKREMEKVVILKTSFSEYKDGLISSRLKVDWIKL